MTDYTWPDDLAPYAVSFYLQAHSGGSESPFSLQTKVYGLSAPRWVCTMSFRGGYDGAAGLEAVGPRVDAMVAQLAGSENRALLYDFRRPAMRTPAWPAVAGNNPVAAGDSAMTITGLVPGMTVLAGDYVGGDGRPHLILSNSVADVSGNAPVTVKPPFAAAIAANQAVFGKPRGAFRLTGDDVGDNAVQVGDSVNITLSFVEDVGGVLPLDPKVAPPADLFFVIGQSLGVGRAPQVTPTPVATLFMFNAGPESASFASPAPPNTLDAAAGGANYASMAAFVPLGGVESLGPGMGYQSAKAGTPRAFYMSAAVGGYSLRMLHMAAIANLRYGLARAVALVRAAGYAPNLHIFLDHGHADADAFDDGSNPGATPTSTATYLIAANKLLATIRAAATNALGTAFTGPIWVSPLLTQNGVASLAARRDIVKAQAALRSSTVKLLPPRSQFANRFDTDLEHPLGQGYRYTGEMWAAFIGSGLTAPSMTAKAVVSGKVEVTFDQAIAISTTTPDMVVPGNSKAGFTVIDNTGAEVAVSAVTVSGTKATLTVASTANLSGSWFVRNGLQQTGTLGSGGASASFMPRTLIVGLTSVGTAEDSTVFENFSIPQEI